MIITTALAVIGVILISATGRLVADEFKEWAPWLTKGLINRAVAVLPEDQQPRYAEEWRSHINEVPGDLSKIFAAAGLILAARRILPETDKSEIYERSLTGWSWRAVLKRTEDVVLATLMLMLVGPAMLAIAAAVKFDSVGPVLIRQQRLGLDNSIIKIWAFRTMAMVPCPSPILTNLYQLRVTRVGRVLRGTNLSLLPQLLSVVKGDMSLIGPHLDVWNYPAALNDYRSHYNFRPGIIGWAQLNGHDTINTLEQAQRHLDYDLSYIRNGSLLLEFKILVRTVGLFLGKKLH